MTEPVKKRGGRPSKEEIAYINKAVIEGKKPEELAEELGRNLDTILTAIEKTIASGLAPAPIEEDDVVNALVASPEWKQLAHEFVAEELTYFKHRYRKLISQFKGDVTATEETQVFHLIKFEIMMNRNLRASKRSLYDIARLEKQVDAIYKAYPDFTDAEPEDRQNAMALESQLLTARTAHQTKSSEFVKLQEKHSSILKELKATREQRQKNMQDQQHTFLGLLKQFQEEEWRAKQGRQMEVARMARDKSYDKLGDYHTYIDGGIDRPILSVETVDKPDKI